MKATKSGYVNRDFLQSYFLMSLRKEKKLIIMDKCATHFGQEMEELYRDINAKISIIPGGCTKYLQPLDATVINSFKRNCERHRVDFENRQVDRRSKSGNLKCAVRQDLINIAAKGWEDVKAELIVKSFELTGTYGASNKHFMNIKI